MEDTAGTRASDVDGRIGVDVYVEEIRVWGGLEEVVPERGKVEVGVGEEEEGDLELGIAAGGEAREFVGGGGAVQEGEVIELVGGGNGDGTLGRREEARGEEEENGEREEEGEREDERRGEH